MAERQMATNLEEVRLDHRRRYEFAVSYLRSLGRLGHVIDAGCGVGYGSAILAEAAEHVSAIEISSEAHQLYQQFWQRDNISYHNTDLLRFECQRRVDAVVCFEFIEHVEFYEEAIRRFAGWSDTLLISTPNEAVRPHLQHPVNPFHVRHFRPEELSEILEQHGFRVVHWHCQRNGSKPEIQNGTNGKFIIAACDRIPAAAAG